MIFQLAAGILLGGLVALLAWRAGALSKSGAWAAAITGGLIFGLGGLPWAALLLTFFVTSSGLSLAFKRRKSRLQEKFSKGHRRDWGQVAANGGLGALLAVVAVLAPERFSGGLWLAFVGAMAAVNADTWATELGVLSPTPPRMITSGKAVERGSSGAISLVGSLAALCGAALVGLVGVIFSTAPFLPILAAAVFGGMIGSFFDSFLGATVQAIYWCPSCQKETERTPRHLCGATVQPLRGWRWLNNDWVNFACSLAGALAGFITWMLLVL